MVTDWPGISPLVILARFYPIYEGNITLVSINTLSNCVKCISLGMCSLSLIFFPYPNQSFRELRQSICVSELWNNESWHWVSQDHNGTEFKAP